MKIAIGVFLSIIIILLCCPIIDMISNNSRSIAQLNEKAEKYGITQVCVTLSESGERVELNFRDYLIGCLFAQIPAFYDEETLKAQAIAANTYSIYLMLNSTSTDNFTDGVDCQPFSTREKALEYYGDEFETAYEKFSAAVDFGINYVITYENEPILPASHRISSGRTDSAAELWSGDFSYLTAKNSLCDVESTEYSGTKQLSAATVRGVLMKRFDGIRLPVDCNEWFQNISRTASGTITSLNVNDETISGSELMQLYSLRSADTSISYGNGYFVFTTRGCGNNLGMSIYGGNEMAKSGATCADILLYYYNNIKIEKIPHSRL